MPISLSGRHFLTLLDFTPEEIRHLLRLSKRFKSLKRAGTPHRRLQGRNVVLLFEKTSTRTRCAFEVAAMDLGMGVTCLDPGGVGDGLLRAHLAAAQVLGRMYDGIEYRGFAQEAVEELAANAGVPVWNGLTDDFHPTQMLADMLTVEESFPRIEGLKLTFMGDARNNVANSLMVACSKLGLHFTACGPEGLMPEGDLVARCRGIAQETGATVTLTDDVDEAAAGAHVLYTDIWVSMGEPDDLWGERIDLLEPYRVTSQAMAKAEPEAIFMHCLPSFHDANTTIGAEVAARFGVTEMEVSDEVFTSAASKVMDEAENRMHTIKAVMYATLSRDDRLPGT